MGEFAPLEFNPGFPIKPYHAEWINEANQRLIENGGVPDIGLAKDLAVLQPRLVIPSELFSYTKRMLSRYYGLCDSYDDFDDGPWSFVGLLECWKLEKIFGFSPDQVRDTTSEYIQEFGDGWNDQLREFLQPTVPEQSIDFTFHHFMAECRNAVVYHAITKSVNNERRQYGSGMTFTEVMFRQALHWMGTYGPAFVRPELMKELHNHFYGYMTTLRLHSRSVVMIPDNFSQHMNKRKEYLLDEFIDSLVVSNENKPAA